MTTQNETGSGHALLIGIDKYRNAPPLHGCGNDVQLMASVLPRFGFLPGNIHKLVDGRATRRAILEGLDHLVNVDEVVFVHFSGWGLRVPRGGSGTNRIIAPWDQTSRDSYSMQKSWPPLSKSSRSRTASGGESLGNLVSALVPYDWDGRSETAITYDEIRAWSEHVSARKLVLVFDAPYAGGLVEGDEAIPSDHVFMGASRFDETCYEFQAASGVYQGALTYYLAQALMEAGPDTIYRDIFYRISAQVSARIPYQHPQFQGDADAPLFATGSPASERLITVKSRQRDRVTLNVGAHGATVRSQWAIYPADMPDITSRTTKLGRVEISAVRATEAEARVLSEAGYEIIKQGAIAVEEAHFFGEMRLTVRIETPPKHRSERDYLAKLLMSSELLELVEGKTAPDAAIIVHLLLPREMAAEDDPVPQLEELAEPTWAAVDRSSALVMPPISAAGSGAVYEVRDRLESRSRYRNVLGLRNPNPNSSLAGKVHFTIMQQQSGGQWTRAEVDRQAGMPVFSEEDHIGLEIVNDHSEPVYVGVLDFGVTTSLAMLYPLQGPTAEVLPGESVSVGMDPATEIGVYLPDDFLSAGGPDDQGAIAGTETLKLFATVYPTDLGRLLLQEGGRGLYTSRGEGAPLWQLLDMALTGVGSRELSRCNCRRSRNGPR